MARKYSNFDHDELAKITHQRGLKSLSKYHDDKLEQPHLDHLKTTQQREGTATVAINRLLKGMLSAVSGSVSGLFQGKQGAHTQCKEYGHTVEPGWKGERPDCVDCGARVNSLDELRKAVPKESGHAKPVDQGRRYVK